jgi:hypothetical protein
MKNRSTWLMVALLVMCASQGVFAQGPGPVVKDPGGKFAVFPDISGRPALYFGGEFGYTAEGESFDQKANGQAFAKIVNLPTMLKGARYVTPGQTITLTKGEAFGGVTVNGSKKYYFNLGFYLFLKMPNGAPPITSFATRLRSGSDVLAQVPFTPAPGQEIKAIHTQVSLPIGESLLTLSIDDDKQVQETSEKNNLYDFKVIVKP